MSRTQPVAYSPIHIILHWIIAALVLFQIVFGEGMDALERALRNGGTPDAGVSFMGNAHIWVGIAVLALTVIRLIVRVAYGVPAPLPGSAMQELAAKAVHGLLYLAMILVPATGLLAWYGGIHTVEELHELAEPLFIVLVSLLVLGALYHQFALKDGGLMRMFSTRS
ncbi:cytochrome b [Roseibium sediminicola]|uniref:Cytochrome b/b6 domain-containing protein n=1 Tax=Roseibium sediminicola TaxID=2933272 RepID=A0ABT0GTC6_9HYPH|nr:cytochrome b/b6 domain-containing protein [Roseibium sp. CAU 1639]MCK7612694.1 cytochrome b/b6 domain-containing protein [Roseibium sp. CAU 1639]